jgi:hypothetical protein
MQSLDHLAERIGAAKDYYGRAAARYYGANATRDWGTWMRVVSGIAVLSGVLIALPASAQTPPALS